CLECRLSPGRGSGTRRRRRHRVARRSCGFAARAPQDGPSRPGDSRAYGFHERIIMSQYFPVALSIERRRCLVVGAGTVAERKVEALLDAGAVVVVVAPAVSQAIEALGRVRAIELRVRLYDTADLEGAFLVVAATDDRAVNA